MIKQLLAVAVLAAFTVSGYAADAKKPAPQQERMAACNKDAGAKNLKGDERKKFMSECLKARKPS